jgi:vancomycin permeability regulator SanA
MRIPLTLRRRSIDFLAHIGAIARSTVPLVAARAIALLSFATVALALFGRDLTWLWFGTFLSDPLSRLVALAVLTPAAWFAPVASLTLGPLFARASELARRAVLAVVAIIALLDALSCFVALARGTLHALTPVPFTLVVGALLAWAAVAPLAPDPHFRRGRARLLSLAGAPLVAGGLVAIQIAGVAFTDYRRPASAIVVLGAAVHTDGSPSEVLAQRMATACKLYEGGYAPLVIVSGGRTPGFPSEPDVMRHVAERCGIPAASIVEDEGGADTKSTAVDSARIVSERHLGAVLVVSHGYHLARAGLAMRRAGVRAFTVPAAETRVLPAKPYYLARELAAWTVYAAAMSPSRATAVR